MKKQPFLICGTMVAATVVVVSLLDRSEAANKQQGAELVTLDQAKLTAKAPVQPGLERRDLVEKRTESADEMPEVKFRELQPKPFAVVHSQGHFQWTAEDGLQNDVIEKLANNPHMVEALQEQNNYTKRRQLIYVDPAFGSEADAVYRGEKGELTLPGFDGEQFTIKVDHTTEFGGYLNGSFTGAIKGQSGTDVVAGSEGNHWSIGIQLKDRHYQIANRSPNEWIISEVDMAAMNAHFGACKTTGDVDNVGL